MLASILRRDHGFRTRILYSLDDEGRVDPEALENIPGTEALSDADLGALRGSMRPEDQLRPILDYAKSGRPIVGLNGDPCVPVPGRPSIADSLNDDWPQEVLGQRWITRPSTGALRDERQAAPGHASGDASVGPFDAYSWLYHVEGGLPESAARRRNGDQVGHRDHDRFPRTTVMDDGTGRARPAEARLLHDARYDPFRGHPECSWASSGPRSPKRPCRHRRGGGRRTPDSERSFAVGPSQATAAPKGVQPPARPGIDPTETRDSSRESNQDPKLGIDGR